MNLSIVHQQRLAANTQGIAQQQIQGTKVFPQNRKVLEIQVSYANISNSV